MICQEAWEPYGCDLGEWWRCHLAMH